MISFSSDRKVFYSILTPVKKKMKKGALLNSLCFMCDAGEMGVILSKFMCFISDLMIPRTAKSE